MLNPPAQKFKSAAPKQILEKKKKSLKDEEVKKEINETDAPSIENTKKSIDLNELEVSNIDINPNRLNRFQNNR
jgi:hypothetical protein